MRENREPCKRRDHGSELDATRKLDVEDACAQITASMPAFSGGIDIGRSVKDAVSGQKDGKGKGEGLENATKFKRKCVINSAVSPPNVKVVGNGSWVDPRAAIQGSLGKTT